MAKDCYTAKYAATDGPLPWEKRYNGPANLDDSTSGLALGPNGMVVVTDSSSGDYATVVCREVLPPVAIALVPAGVLLSLQGILARSYDIERAPAVTGPWSILATAAAPTDSFMELADTSPLAGTGSYCTSER